MAQIEPIDHAVSRYAIDVVEGREVAGKMVQLACERHLQDLETGADRGLWFDPDAASRVLNFAPLLHHTTGPLGGQPLRLEPWQKFRHGSVFGWKNEDGTRRFRSTYHQVGKKNGKTTDTAVPMLYSLLFDGEAAPQAYCAATTKNQARLLFKEIGRMVKRSDFLPKLIDVGRHEMEVPATDGALACLSRDGDSSDGINPHFLARDEVHRWTDRELAETIVESMIARGQPIDWAITTAGHDLGSIAGETRIYAENVLRGSVVDDAFFGYVAEPPADCDPLDPVAWKMGNPNLGISKPESAMRAAAEKALVIQAAMPNFRRFHLNLWTEGAQTWIGRDVWDAGGMAAPFELEELRGCPAWAAFDLSKTVDTTALVFAVLKDGQIYLVAFTFLPAGPKGFQHRAKEEKREYVAWRDAGWLEVHEGGKIDRARVRFRLEQMRDLLDLREVAFDPWDAREFGQELAQAGFNMVEHRQGFGSMSGPMKRFEERVAGKEIRHGGNPVLAWQVGNVHRDEDAAGNIKPNKRRSRGRIDAAVAAIMALGRAEFGAGKKSKRRGVDSV